MQTYYEFEVGIEELGDRMRKISVFIEYRSHGDVASELHEVVVYRNADGIAVIESDIYEGNDYINAYKLIDRNDIISELEEFDLDHDDLDQVAEYMLYRKLIEVKQEAEDHSGDDELIERVNEELKKISFLYKYTVKREVMQVIAYEIETMCPYCGKSIEAEVESLPQEDDCVIFNCPECGGEIHLCGDRAYRKDTCPIGSGGDVYNS